MANPAPPDPKIVALIKTYPDAESYIRFSNEWEQCAAPALREWIERFQDGRFRSTGQAFVKLHEMFKATHCLGIDFWQRELQQRGYDVPDLEDPIQHGDRAIARPPLGRIG
jgi:hypothetical protein